MVCAVGFCLLCLLLLECEAEEVIPHQYILKPPGDQSRVDSNCDIDEDRFSACNQSSLLLDSVHGPQSFSEDALETYYTLVNDRMVFQFLSPVDLEFAQIYYYINLSDASTRVQTVNFFDVDTSYHPRLNLPSSAVHMGTFEPSIGEFKSDCAIFGEFAPIQNLVVTMPQSTALYISEVNFFNSSVSSEVCDGIFLPDPPTMAPASTTESPGASTSIEDDATSTQKAEDTTSEPPATTTRGVVTPEEVGVSGISTGGIVGAVIGAVVVAVILILSLIFAVVVVTLHQRKKSSSKVASNDSNMEPKTPNKVEEVMSAS